MKKHSLRKALTVFPLAAACAAFGSVAQAQSVTFTGNLLGATCTPSVTNGTVTLPNAVLGTDLTGSDSTAKETAFTVSLTGCGTAGSGLKGRIYFWQNGSNGGRLVKNSGNGSGWQYQLLAGASGNTILTVGTGSAVQPNTNDPGVDLTTNQNYSVTYRVRYYRPGTTTLTPGTLNATANMVFYAQ